MKIEPQAGAPAAPTPTNAQPSPRERAINALLGTKTQSQESPVLNPSRVSAEELSAVTSQSNGNTEQAQLPSNESVSESKAESKVPDEKLSSQYAILARKEKQQRQRDQQLRAREAAVKAAEDLAKSVKPSAPPLDESKYVPKDRLTTDPFSVLTELGLTYDQLTEMALNAPKAEQIATNNELRALRAELQALKDQSDKTTKSFEEQQTQSYQQAVNQIRVEAKQLIEKDPNFETIRETNSLRDVVELVERTFKQDGILLTVEDAAQQVEDYLVDEALKLARIKKIQHRLATKPTQSQKPTGDPKQQQLKTLTNAVSSTRQLSARERALLAFEGKLKS